MIGCTLMSKLYVGFFVIASMLALSGLGFLGLALLTKSNSFGGPVVRHGAMSRGLTIVGDNAIADRVMTTKYKFACAIIQ
jgi:hypothetical protein